MAKIELLPERTANGTVIFRAVLVSPGERLRRLARRLLGR